MRRIAVLTSGGDAPGMNAAVRAVVRKAIYDGIEVVGIKRGYTGLISGEFVKMNLGSVADIIHRGGTILHTARSEKFKTPEGRQMALENLRKHGIDGLIVIGGDGSFRGAQALNALGMPVVGVPATIDNDIPCTDYTIGFDTCINTVAEAVDKIRDTATALERNFVIEVMGRDAGYIAMMAGLATGAESIIIPEVGYNIDEICARLLRGEQRGKRHSIILVAEGVARGYEVAQRILERTGIETRLTVLGHIQRGGSPSSFDRILASRLGAKAVEVLAMKEENKMVGMVGTEIKITDFSEVFAQTKQFNRDIYDLTTTLAI